MVVSDLISSIPWLENGFEVVGSNTNAIEAIAEIASLKPDVVFSDFKMPACNGVELIRRVKEINVDTEFVILSAHADFSASRDFFLMGGIDYILKPLDQSNSSIVLEKVSRKLAKKFNKTPSTVFVPSQSKGFDELVNYVTANFNKKHTLDDLSNRYNMNPTYICDLFSKHYGSTLTIFITNLRMKEASRLILETDTPFKEISISCGYSDYYHFSRIFKAHFGMAPSQFRGQGSS